MIAAPRWHQIKDDHELAQHLCGLCDTFEREQSSRRSRSLQLISLYEGQRLEDLTAKAYLRGGAYSNELFADLYWNVPRSLVHTVVAEIPGQIRPKPQFMATDAEWTQKRRALKLDRFVEGQLAQPCGVYADFWDLATQTFQDGCIDHAGVIKIWSDHEEGRVQYDRVFQFELYVDPVECMYGAPLNLFHVYGFDKDQLIARYPGFEREIEHADTVDERYGSSDLRRSCADRVKVREAWRLPFSPDKPGRWARIIKGAVLEEREWTRPEFPFIFSRWSRRHFDFWGKGLVEEVESICSELNTEIQRMQESTRLTSKGVLISHKGALSDEDASSNEDAIRIEVEPGFDLPTWVNPEPFGPHHVQWIEMQRSAAYEIPGISQLAATARKEPGINSGAGLRRLEAMQSKRLSDQEHKYELLVVAAARHTVACVRELYEENKDFASKWPGKGFIREIKWGDVDMPEDQYSVAIAPVGKVKNTPAERLEEAEELLGAGILSPEAYVRVRQYLDTPAELQRLNKQQELLEKYIGDWLDATPEAVEKGTFRFRSPHKFMIHEDALLQIGQAYMQAELDSAPDFNLEFFLRYLTELNKIIEDKAAKAAQMQAPPQMAPAPMQPAPMVS